MASHNPWAALSAIPAGAATYAATSPNGFSSLAHLLNDPVVLQKLGLAAGIGTRIPETAIRGLGYGSPYDPSQGGR